MSYCIFACSFLNAPICCSLVVGGPECFETSHVTSELFKTFIYLFIYNYLVFSHLPNPSYRRTDKISGATKNPGTLIGIISRAGKGEIFLCQHQVKTRKQNYGLRPTARRNAGFCLAIFIICVFTT